VDVSQPTVPTCPFPITDSPLGEGSYPDTIGIKPIAEVEVLYLYLMLTCCHPSNDVLVLTDGGKGRTFGGGNTLSPTLQKMPDNADLLT
jgi:hypothetical protein